jgi:hypothetical protein
VPAEAAENMDPPVRDGSAGVTTDCLNTRWSNPPGVSFADATDAAAKKTHNATTVVVFIVFPLVAEANTLLRHRTQNAVMFTQTDQRRHLPGVPAPFPISKRGTPTIDLCRLSEQGYQG